MGDNPYSEFEKVTAGGEKVKLIVKDLDENDEEALVEFIIKYFINEEKYFVAAGVAKSEKAREEVREIFLHIMEDKESTPVVCYDATDASQKKIVGCNLFYVSGKTDEEIPEPRTPETAALFRIIKVLEQEYAIREKLNIDKELSGAGLSVDPKYRGCGIATELLKARRPILEKRGLKLTSAWFTSIGSQKAAVRAGYELVHQMPYKELGTKAQVSFTDVPEFCKLMMIKL